MKYFTATLIVKKLFKRMILKYPRLSKSGISQKRHLVATEDISIINQALKIYLQKSFQEAPQWVSRDNTILNTVTRPTSKFSKICKIICVGEFPWTDVFFVRLFCWLRLKSRYHIIVQSMTDLCNCLNMCGMCFKKSSHPSTMLLWQHIRVCKLSTHKQMPDLCSVL